MEQIVEPGRISGSVRIPGSKSHTMRALFLATLAEGTSRIGHPLDSGDTLSARKACRALGAEIHEREKEWLVEGTAGRPHTPQDVIDVGNSGTTLRFALGTASLADGWSVFTGDEQIRNRPVGPLVSALVNLGAEAFTTRGGEFPPAAVRGRLKGGKTRISCPTSQYLSSLLLASPLAEKDTRIEVLELNEKPYVGLTLEWLDFLGIRCTREGWDRFQVSGGQHYRAFTREIPGDYSSATFFLCAAAVTGSRLSVSGLSPDDSQGDRQILTVLEEMGCRIQITDEGVVLEGGKLKGIEWDLNDIPDALPALAVTACFAEGETRLVNVPQARLKETDRIAVMREELSKMGGRIRELPDGMIIEGAPLQGAAVDGHNDHRVVMALAVAGLRAAGATRIQSAESAEITFPGFFRLLDGLRTKDPSQ